MSAEDVVFTGWLIKSPPEKKLKRYAWRRRWFVLRRGRMSGNPDVLEYYRSKSSKKPIRSIDLRECKVQMESNVQLVKREFQNQPLFVVKTLTRVYYLVAKTEEEMNCWVSHISQICHFSPLNDERESAHIFSHAPSSPQPSPPDSARVSRAASHDLTADASATEDSRSESESSLPPDYLVLSQCETGRVKVNSFNSCSNSERSLEQNSSDNAFEDVFFSPLSASQILSPFSSGRPLELSLSTSCCSTPLCRTLDRHASATSSPASDVFQFDKPPSSLPPGGTMDGHTPPPRPPKPSRFSEHCGDEAVHYVALRSTEGPFSVRPAPIPRRISLPGLDHIRREFDTKSERRWNKRLSLNLPHLTTMSNSNSTDCCDDSYVPMNSGTSPPATVSEHSPDGYIPMSPLSIKYLLSNNKAENLQATPNFQVLPNDMEPPPVNRDLKPRRRARPPPLDLRGLSTIRECPFHLPLMRTLTEPGPSTNWFSLERRCNTGGNPANGEGNCLPAEPRQLLFPASGSPTPHMPRTSNLDYLSLDFNSASPSPVQKKALLADEQRVDYVQVDKKKTQALQNTKMDWKDFRQSKE
uniref:GRB2 associated binding protein 3 n=1 Tax=Paramormyrops kingsleyae TaxID=1676925 RepID=A0A3B3Q787_9TELE|nr:GRB2-associated-binding protein 3-like [Paramormyrops kingsleyae]